MEDFETLIELGTKSKIRQKIVALTIICITIVVVIPTTIYFVIIGKNDTRTTGTTEIEKSTEVNIRHNVTEITDFYTPTTAIPINISEAANRLLSSMNSSVDPCDDFYAFSCGNFKRSPNQRSISRIGLLQRKIYNKLKDALESTYPETETRAVFQAKVMYKSCLNLENENGDLERLKILLGEIGGWPIANYHYNEDSYSLFHGAAIAIKKAGVAPLVNFFVGADDRNTTRNVIKLFPPETPVIRINHFMAEITLRQVALKLGGDPRTINDDLWKMEELEQRIESIIKKTEANDNDGVITKIKDLDDLIPEINFIEFFQTLSNDTLNPLHEYISVEDEVVIQNKEYLLQIAHLIKQNIISERTLANYLGAKLILKYPLLTRSEELLFYNYESEISYDDTKTISWLTCITDTVNFFEFATDYLYITNSKEDKEKNEKDRELIEDLKESFRTLAKESKWLDEETLSSAIEKLDAMSILIDYPPWILNQTLLDLHYNTLPDLTENFETNVMITREFIVRQNLILLRKFNNITDWPDSFGMAATDVNAAYLKFRNSIYFPLAIQYQPFYDPNQPWYLNFAAIGTIIGHEITHGFDSHGSRRDKRGNLKNWWSAKSKHEFDEKTNCFVNQFNEYYMPDVNMKVNGTRTLAENIADSGGVREAFLAYQNWEKKYGKETSLPGLEKYSPYQLFFLGYANAWCADYDDDMQKYLLEKDVHSPNKYRIIGTLSNFETFSNVYKCPVGSNMNPSKKCIIW